MNSYLDMMRYVLTNGNNRPDRTGTGTRSVFGYQFRHDLQTGFPLLTTKRIHTRSVLYELIFFLRGMRDNKWLNDHGVSIWDEWDNHFTTPKDLGRVYGVQWRDWRSPYIVPGGIGLTEVDQIKELIDGIKRDPMGRRHIVTAWNPGELDQMALPPCHMFFQCYVEKYSLIGRLERLKRQKDFHTNSTDEVFLNKVLDEEGISKGELSLQMYQRSADLFLGVPFNIASYAILTHMIADCCQMDPGELIITFGDLHIYQNHMEQCAEQLKRLPGVLPQLTILRKVEYPWEYDYEDIAVVGYNPQPSIKAPIAV